MLSDISTNRQSMEQASGSGSINMAEWKKESDGMDNVSNSENLFDAYQTDQNRNQVREENGMSSLYDGSAPSITGSAGDEENRGLGGRETVQVTRLRMFVLLVLFLAASGVSTAVFKLTKKAERDEFETQYDGVAAKVLESFEEIVSEKLAALSAFGVTVTSYSQAQNKTFPFVTMNNFQERAGSMREVVDCLLISIVYLVSEEERGPWAKYTSSTNQWYFEDMKYQEEEGIDTGMDPAVFPYVPFIYRFNEQIQPEYDNSPGPYMPVWQSSPLLLSLPNYNARSDPTYGKVVATSIQTGSMTIGGIMVAPPGNRSSLDARIQLWSILLSLKEGKSVPYDGSPMAVVALPICDSLRPGRKAVGSLQAQMDWATYFKGVVPPKSKPVVVVLENACDGPYTYKVDNKNVLYMGQGDLHEPRYNELMRRANFDALIAKSYVERRYNAFTLDEMGCPYSIRVYPTSEMENANETNIPFITTFSIAAVFVFTGLVFWAFNVLVERRQQLVLTEAKQSTELVSTFLPTEVQKRLLHDSSKGYISSTSRLKAFLSEGDDKEAKPIADLFPFCTVLFADIAGFTAWSSTREPAQVFVLLQTLYQSFDIIAKKHKVFKVETIGDSYVAVTGLPNEQHMHAVLMARFAWDCLTKMNVHVKEMERTLGPDTGDLAMRFGMHSGPVIAGVLRGDRPRFQLFGDTVNTAARMESTSMQNRIQVSHTTAAEIEKLGKGRWLSKREDLVIAKGKGAIESFWLNPISTSASIESSHSSKKEKSGLQKVELHLETNGEVGDKQSRLVDWCVEILLDKLRQIQALRQCLFLTQTSPYDALVYKHGDGHTCMEEVQDVLELPPYNPKAATILASIKHQEVKIEPEVVNQLRQFVSILAQAYQPNSFHNFEHACHVTMSVDKFLKRIISPNMDGDIKTLHEYTHGLTSDPLLLMAIVLSALIHDIDHAGVSNT